MRSVFFIFVTLINLVVASESWSPRPDVSVLPDGRISVGGLTLVLTHHDETWHSTYPPRAVNSEGQTNDGSWRLDASWQLPHGEAILHQAVHVDDNDGIILTAALTNAGVTKSFSLSTDLDAATYRGSVLYIDGAAVALPAAAGPELICPQSTAKIVTIPLPNGEWLDLAGDLLVRVQDNSQWKMDTFTIRVVAERDNTLAVKIRVRQPKFAAIPLGTAADVPRRDDIAGDGNGGWTDQGDNDLRILPSGSLTASGRPFSIGDNAIVLAGEHIANRTRTAEVSVAEGAQGAALYLLHALAWAPSSPAPIGRVHLRYRDGSSESRDVVSGRDVADWWRPVEKLPNAALGWSGDTHHAAVGLYVQRLPISDKPLASVGLEVLGGAVWMVVGISLGEDAPLPTLMPDSIVEGQRWRPVTANWEVEPGSALDLGALTPAPLPGRLVVRGPHFVLESRPEVPVRLLGANLCFTANYPDKPLAERMVAAFRAMGHNSVRIHHYDRDLVPPGGDGSTLDSEKVDRLDYLIACCKKSGLWITTDLYVSRKLPKGAISELPDDSFGQEFKALVPILPSAMANWKRFATVLMTHRNPYTGMTWGEDPVLATISLINEDNLPSVIDRPASVRKLYDQRFESWIVTRPAEEQSGEPRAQARGRWLMSLQAAACNEMRSHLRSLGVQTPTTSANHHSDWWSLAVRDRFDYIDNHMYHDHPGFPVQDWRLPNRYVQHSAVESMLLVPARLAQTRRLDLPFTVTELNYCAPNHRRAEYAAAIPSVAGLQDWDGVWRFAFSHSIKSVEQADAALGGFDLVHDPIALLGERAMALLWRRGNVAPAPWSAGVVYDPDLAGGLIGAKLDTSVSLLALHAKVGCLPAAKAAAWGVADLRCLLQDARGGTAPAGGLPILNADAALPAALLKAGLVKPGQIDAAAKRVVSSTGQIAIDGKAGRLTVETPMAVAAVLPGGAKVTLSGVEIVNSDQEPATVVIAALDGSGFTDAKRLLVLHLTDAANSGASFASRNHTLLENWGRAPVLVRTGAIRVLLPGAAAKAFALDLRGKRQEEIALTANAGGQRLDANVARAWGACLAWEVVRP